MNKKIYYGEKVMRQNLPDYIKNDKDLVYYERHLRSLDMTNNSNNHTDMVTNRHKNLIGKIVKVESLIGNRLMCRTGTLMEVGEHHIIIKPSQNAVTIMIPMDTVKYVTIIHSKGACR